MSTAARFRALHTAREPGLLLLANVWDALSARLVAASGAEALATSSAAVAWARGYTDGERLPLGDLLDAVAAMARGLACPLSVDLERGYADGADEVAGRVAQVVQAGAVGVNLEDGGGDPEALAAKIGAVRRRLGDSVFVNARTCVAMPMHGGLTGEAMTREVLRRAHLYADAGADGLFVPWLAVPSEVEAVARGTSLPLNLMLDPRTPPVSELARLGVRRLSTSVRVAAVAYTAAAQAARGLLRGDTTALLDERLLMYPQLQGLMAASELAGSSLPAR